MPQRILRLIELRLIIGFSLLLSFLIIQLSIVYLFPHFFFFSFLGLLFALSLVYLIIYKINVRNEIQALIQLLGDWVLVSFLVLNTGGYSSSLYFLFIFIIVEAFIFLGEKGGLYSTISPIITYLIFSFTTFYLKYPFVEFKYSAFLTNLITYAMGFPLLGYLLSVSKGKIKSLTERFYTRENLISFFRKLDELLSEETGDCFLLIEGGKIVAQGKNCGKFPVGDLITKKGEFKIKGKIFNVTRIDMGPMELIILGDYSRIEEITRRDGIKDAVSILSHELRNPLASLIGAVQIFPIADDKKKEHIVELIRENAERIKNILEQWERLRAEKLNTAQISAIIKELLFVEDARWNEYREGEKIVIERQPSFKEEEIKMVVSPELKTLNTGKGLLALELSRAISISGLRIYSSEGKLIIERR